MSRPSRVGAVTESDRWLVGWGVGYVAVGGASLAVPLYAVELGAGAFVVGLIAASAALVGVPGALLWGWLVSRTRRRRPFLLVALGTAALVLAVIPLLDSPLSVLVGNAALWFVVAAATPVLNLVVVEGVPQSRWGERIGVLNAYQGYGWVAGLLVGTAWTTAAPRLVDDLLALRLLVFGFGGVAALGLALVAARYPERPTTTRDRFRRAFRRLGTSRPGAGRYLRTIPYGPNRLYWSLVAARPVNYYRRFDPRLRLYLLAVALFSTGFAAFWGPMPAYLPAVGYATETVFSLFLLANVGSAVCYALAGTMSDRGDPFRLQSVALGARVVLFPLVPLVGRVGGAVLFVVGAAFLLVGATWAFIAVTAAGLVSRLAAPAGKGEALGAHTAVAGVGGTVGSVVGGAVAVGGGFTLAFGLAGGLVAGGLAVAALAR